MAASNEIQRRDDSLIGTHGRDMIGIARQDQQF
jgi:hypothetical protein